MTVLIIGLAGMPDCPRCHQPVKADAIACPHCRAVLKAYGHPGITLYRAKQEEYLCQTCIYHEDDTCNFPQRPYAKECTLYNRSGQKLSPTRSAVKPSDTARMWLRRNAFWLVLLGLVAISVFLAFADPAAQQGRGESGDQGVRESGNKGIRKSNLTQLLLPLQGVYGAQMRVH